MATKHEILVKIFPDLSWEIRRFTDDKPSCAVEKGRDAQRLVTLLRQYRILCWDVCISAPCTTPE